MKNTAIASPPRIVPRCRLSFSLVLVIVIVLMPDSGRSEPLTPGTVLWKFVCGFTRNTAPSVGQDGTIYVGGQDPDVSSRNNFFAIKPDGTEKWRREFGHSDDEISSSLITPDGTIIVGAELKIYALNPGGSQKWAFATGASIAAPALGPDGTIYAATSEAGWETTVVALNPDGSKKWDYTIYSSGALGISVDVTGEIYVATRRLTALSPAGAELWEESGSNSSFIQTAVALSRYGAPYGRINNSMKSFRSSLQRNFHGSSGANAPVISTDGSVYAVTNGQLLASRYDGSPAWQLDIGDFSNTNKTSPAIGADGTIYVGSERGFYAVNADGTIKWKSDPNTSVNNSPVVGPDGTVYVVSYNTLLAFHDDTGDLPNRWNTFRGDVTRSGRALAPLNFPFFDRGSPTRDGSFDLVIVNEPNRPVSVERSTDFTDWEFIEEKSSANGFIYFKDSGFQESPHSFYRASSE